MPINFDLDTIDIVELSDLPETVITPITASVASVAPVESTGMGMGMELLMNDKRLNRPNRSKSGSDEQLNVESLEDELNQLSSESIVSDADATKTTTKSSLFDTAPRVDVHRVDDDPSPHVDTKPNVSFDDIHIGQKSAEPIRLAKDDNTWDGYGKINNVPINPDMDFAAETKLSPEALLREKFKYLRKLEAIEQKGVSLSKKYSMDSDLAEMKGEYEMVVDEKERKNSVKFQGKMMMAAITGLEFLNNKVDPFDVNLDGWGEQINENISDYDEIFAELHEKYKSKAKIAPELKLLFQLGGSAIMVHMTNSMFKTAVPGMDDIMRQNPDLMRQFSQAAVNTMGQSNPGFGGFMNDVVGQGSQPPPQPPVDRGGSNYASADAVPRRQEMKGPSDISSILSNIKTKQQSSMPSSSVPDIRRVETDVGSTISIQELNEMRADMNAPRSKKRPKSERNSISIDI